MPLSNAEKQARFRKKEELKQHVSRTHRDCVLTASRQALKTAAPDFNTASADLLERLKEAASLPSGWTDKDLELAHTRIRNIRGDILGTGDPLGNDVKEGRNASEEFKRTPNPQKWMADIEKAERDTIALASHLISALQVSQLQNEDRAAALMEAVRYVGRALGNSSSEGQSDAMAVCLAAVNSHYERPDWFVPRFAHWLQFRLDDETRIALGKRLLKPNDQF